MAKGDPQTDPKGLIEDSYKIEGIVIEECRSIFMDWALSLPEGQEAKDAIRILLERHRDEPEDHPMSLILRDGLLNMATPVRRGGAGGRDRPAN